MHDLHVMDVSGNTERNCARDIQVTRHFLHQRHLCKMALEKNQIHDETTLKI
jgi:hypothetical protein